MYPIKALRLMRNHSLLGQAITSTGMMLFLLVVHVLLWEACADTTLPPFLHPDIFGSLENSSDITLNSASFQPNEGLCKFDEEAIGNRFSLHLKPLNWFNAMIVCWKAGGQLAVPRSPQEAKALGALLFKTRSPAGEVLGEAMHVGIQDIAQTSSWRTLDGSLLSAVGYDLWLEGGEGVCGALLADGRYMKQPCHIPMRYACEKPNSLALREASDYVEVGDAGRFRLYEEPLPWALALRHCEEEGATLAVPTSPREAGLLAGALFTRAASNPRLQRNGFFVGITDVAKEGDWRTLRGDTLTLAGYDSWTQSHPSVSRRENCGALQRDGRYADYPCMSSMAYVCQSNTEPRDTEEVVVRGRYRLHKKPLSWFEALQACQRENATLFAATIGEKSDVLELMKGGHRGSTEVYTIHVSIYMSNSTWKYIYSEDKPPATYMRGSESMYEDYHEHPQSYEETLSVRPEYNGYSDCAGMRNDGNYYTVTCSKNLPYVCKRK